MGRSGGDRPAFVSSGGSAEAHIYGYLNRVQSSRRLEHEAGRNVEVMWLTGRLAPDHKTIADFRKDNGRAGRQVCARFVALCRTMGPANASQRRDRRQLTDPDARSMATSGRGSGVVGYNVQIAVDTAQPTS
jgi:Transposase domain (DUF772)